MYEITLLSAPVDLSHLNHNASVGGFAFVCFLKKACEFGVPFVGNIKGRWFLDVFDFTLKECT